ncbi:protein TolA [Bacterioplanes sanyensis]|uniref:Protein TolA n=1 Tax=Bacterioplanes sanyensis TaxID=1249553 RepID=A0A222FL05_9GAMM|nr:cell envelope integrity protein TolA [Bacterioplanes sanyensis]ASP39460.1 protein TolA [Bacterioplanes sanyensis]
MLLRPEGYGFPVLLAVLLHAGVMALFVVQWDHGDIKRPEPVPRHMIANVIQEENKAVKQRQQEAKRQAAERQRQQAARKAQEKRQRQQAEKKRQAEEKAKREQQARREREKKAQQQRDAEAAKKREQAQRREQQRQQQQRLEEQRRQQQLAEEQALLEQRQREQALQQRLQAEAAAAADAQAAATHTDLIRAQIEAAWRYPPAVQKNQQVTLRLTLVPTGEVVQVEVVESSGNRALDRSVEQAVLRASPLPVPDNIRVFERQFRSFTMKFRPENALW